MRHVLVAEDDIHLRASMQHLLEEAGYRVSTATNGMDALRLLSGFRPDLVILDLMMPTFSGWEFLRELRSHPTNAKTPVLVASAIDVKPEGLDVDGFIHKPFDSSTLLSHVDRLAQPRGLGSNSGTGA